MLGYDHLHSLIDFEFFEIKSTYFFINDPFPNYFEL